MATDDLLGLTEVGALLGVSRQRADQLSKEYSDFPEPAAQLSSGRVWRRPEVEQWIARHPDRGPGYRKPR